MDARCARKQETVLRIDDTPAHQAEETIAERIGALYLAGYDAAVVDEFQDRAGSAQ
jgi:hypothetical protein